VPLTALFYAATHFFASYHIAPGQVTARSGLELLAGRCTRGRSRQGSPMRSSRCWAVGVVLGMVRRCDRQHRRLHRPARRLGVGDAGRARA